MNTGDFVYWSYSSKKGVLTILLVVSLANIITSCFNGIWGDSFGTLAASVKFIRITNWLFWNEEAACPLHQYGSF